MLYNKQIKNNIFIIKNNYLKNLKLRNIYFNNKKNKIFNYKNNYFEFIKKSKFFFIKKKFILLQTPEVEDFIFNYKLLNIYKKDINDSFYLKNKILRTHTSCLQNRFLKNYLLNKKVFNIGKVYRNDIDIIHLPIFFQIDFFINNYKIKKILLFLLNFLSFIFKRKFYFRIRKTKFPFTINSFELDILKNFNWLEVAGFGETNKNIILNNFLNKKFIAGGLGLDRIYYFYKKINNIKNIYD
ncbi:hypothetical protein MEJ65_00620 [Candidatus Carsonella ruddii]|uniref:Aminoacyl-transfer RNA synthetases class-II family profile domain-containing protein n=1 Tax=Carsonella ruddii TaxID=114186 RepID=A0AAJ6JXL8_CARRU|nr:hypothetical protein [Candidatus Carsonella ruddii]WGS66581.1 hypothetical protein MEJ66_00625 [Candidatus Carsonella ruddii]WGS67162.1 hypothetical protein MEJ65_00620 [Candidatus Carsonella ruddii]WMC18176.1 MAG: hypothetical protein NU472_00615 [Candidatus Carsonella ruddii]WMC18370.1 MAG: hypothetical protein NU470_00615 [Candidatus Carsonella ruddii]WMC18564.1 MAG: hypothetical protein NU471_00620 [Candidatus Carsonella ruddii]